MTTEQHNKEQEQLKRNEELVKREVYACVTPMVEYILRISSHYGGEHNSPFNYDDIENLYSNETDAEGFDNPDPQPQEIYEWWAVSPWLYEQLKAQGEPVIDSFPHLWGRTCSGQAIALDSVITRIEQKLRKAVEE